MYKNSNRAIWAFNFDMFLIHISSAYQLTLLLCLCIYSGCLLCAFFVFIQRLLLLVLGVVFVCLHISEALLSQLDFMSFRFRISFLRHQLLLSFLIRFLLFSACIFFVCVEKLRLYISTICCLRSIHPYNFVCLFFFCCCCMRIVEIDVDRAS